jgi:PIN domain nuclease of toxin-antitoxin system
MSRLLLDSHVFLWWMADDRKLKAEARAAIRSSSALVHVSAATIWEIAMKARLGKVTPGTSKLSEEIAANGFVELPIAARHAEFAGNLAAHHDDPFDRMLIAQSLLEGLTIVTHDKRFAHYKPQILWT